MRKLDDGQNIALLRLARQRRNRLVLPPWPGDDYIAVFVLAALRLPADAPPGLIVRTGENAGCDLLRVLAKTGSREMSFSALSSGEGRNEFDAPDAAALARIFS